MRATQANRSMERIRQHIACLVLVLITSAHGSGAKLLAAEQPPTAAFVPQLEGRLLPGERVVHAVETTVRSSGERLCRVVIEDDVTQTVRKTTVDEYGDEVDLASRLGREQKSLQNAYGRLAADVFARATEQPEAFLEVVVIHAVPPLPPRPDSQDEEIAARHARAVAEALAANGEAVVGAIRSVGGEILDRMEHAPLVRAAIPGHALLEELAHHPLVESISMPLGEDRELLAAASTTDLNLIGGFYEHNYYGSDAKIGITGEEGSSNCTIDFTHLYLRWVNHTTSTAPTTCSSDADCTACSGRCNDGVCTVWHGTMVAGMAGHVRSLIEPRGAAIARLYMTNSRFSHAKDLEWLFTQGVLVENESWLGSRTDVWAQDWYSMLGMVTTEAAGNGGFTATASCHGSNTLCVGAYWHTSSMWTGSSAANFTSCSQWTTGCDREVPHVVFHGGAATSTTNDRSDADGLAVASGTSLAAPAAAGLVGLMYDRWGGTFFGWPEAVRAAMMASADRDVHHPTHTSSCPTNGKTYSDYHCPDELDGAGVPNAERLEAMMSNSRVKRFNWDRDSSFDAQNRLVAAQVWVPAGKRLRAVLSWTGCPSKTFTGANAAHADLDLHILNPSGQRVVNAASYDGTYEIGELVATSSGTYTLEVEKFGWNSCSGLGTGVYAGVAFDVR